MAFGQVLAFVDKSPEVCPLAFQSQLLNSMVFFSSHLFLFHRSIFFNTVFLCLGFQESQS